MTPLGSALAKTASVVCLLGAAVLILGDTVDTTIAGGLAAYMVARALTFWPARSQPPA